MHNQIRSVFLPNIDTESATVGTFHNPFTGSEQLVLGRARYVFNAFIIMENRLKEINA